MTQITRKSVPKGGLTLLLAMFLGAGLVLSGCGDDDTATTPAPAPPPPAPATPEPEPPAPEAPATPTGLMASATVDSITWTWNSVEGATMYAIQVSTDEMFDATDEITVKMETTHTVSGLEPETSLYARVAAATGTMEDPVQSAWTTHVTGMSSMTPPPPPPAAPDPVMVEFTFKGLPLMPDKSKDEKKAMATVNSDITVTSNTMAVIEPMGFAEGASSVSVQAGENMPFKFVDWKAMQSMVVNDGVTFKITRQTLGANQEMTPTGDVAYVTCGPFRCQSGMDAPEITADDSTVCAAWDPTMRLEVGVISPGLSATTRAIGDDAQPGLDLGWVYTANTTVNITHDFGTFRVSGGTAGKTTKETALPAGRPTATPNAQGTRYPRRRNIESDGTQPGLPIPDGTDTPSQVVIGVGDCYHPNPTVTAGTYDLYNDREMLKPNNCFRLTVDSSRRYLNTYSVKLAPKDSAVSWGEIGWDAFKGLKCDEGEPFEALDSLEMDVCDLLEAEVDRLELKANSAGWLDISTETNGSTAADTQLQGFDLNFRAIDRGSLATQWTELHYYDKTTRSPSDTWDLYEQSTTANTQNTPGRVHGQMLTAADGPIYPATPTPGVHHRRWIELLDGDGNPKYGDLGKVDAANATLVPLPSPTATTPAGGDDRADNFSRAHVARCTAVDGGSAKTSTRGSNGTLCDAVQSISTSVTFTDGMGFGCTYPKKYDLECHWDASGGFGDSGQIGFRRGTDLTSTGGGIGKFLRCKLD